MTLQRMPIARAARSSFISSLSFRRAAARRHLASTSIPNIPQDERIEEELLPDYAADDFYPVTIGDVYNGKYKIVAKLGFGRASTVWLARIEHWWNWFVPIINDKSLLTRSTPHHQAFKPPICRNQSWQIQRGCTQSCK